MLGTIAALLLSVSALAYPMRQFAVGANLSPAPVSNTYYQGEVVKLSPLIYLRLGESSGTTAVDAMGFEDGEYIFGPTLGTPGLITSNADTAVTFNGMFQWTTIPHSPPVSSTTFTVVIWANPTLSGFSAMAAKYDNPGTCGGGFGCGWTFRIDPGGTVTLVSYAPVSGYTVVSSTGSYGGAKHCFALRVGNGCASIYIDGVLDGAGPIEDIATTASPLTVGAQDGVPSSPFNGILDEFSYWTEDIGASAILNLYTVGSTP